jgi:hypothetical protein
MPLNEVVSKKDFLPTTYGELRDFATTVANSGMAPKGYAGKPDDVLVAMVMGAELGLKPLQALQNIAVINGRPSLWGDALLALVISHRECVDVREEFEYGSEPGSIVAAVCTVMRRGREPIVRRFSVADAKVANLWTKAGPWKEYPTRMLSMRARGFACRDAFPDALRGIVTVEESRDMPDEREIGGEVVRRDTRTDAALEALGKVTELALGHEAHETVDQATGEITREADPVAVSTSPSSSAEDPKTPATTPTELKACFARIDTAATIEAVNEQLDYARSFTGDAKRAVSKRAALRIAELRGKP